jgi:nucleotide-binding universal stress UspA family protein
MKSTLLHRWGNPEAIPVATNLLDAPHLVPHAIVQAKLSQAKVLLVHVVEPSYLRASPADGPPFVMPGPTVRSVLSELNRLVKQFQYEGILCEPIVLKGLPNEQIPALVRKYEVDRVIVGTRSAETLDRILLGSVADDLLHQLDVPVCVVGPHVRPQVAPDQEPAAILFAASFHRESNQSAELAIELANLYQSRLVLLHVMEPKHAKDEEGMKLRKQREEELTALITEEARLWSSPVILVREGDPAREILATAKELSADLIVLGATGASRSSGLLAAGVVHRVIAEAKAPVLTLRQEHEMPESYLAQVISTGENRSELS